MESNDSPEIPERGGDIRHPRPPFGVLNAHKKKNNNNDNDNNNNNNSNKNKQEGEDVEDSAEQLTIRL